MNNFLAKIPILAGISIGGFTWLAIVFFLVAGLLTQTSQRPEFYLQQTTPNYPLTFSAPAKAEVGKIFPVKILLNTLGQKVTGFDIKIKFNLKTSPNMSFDITKPPVVVESVTDTKLFGGNYLQASSAGDSVSFAAAAGNISQSVNGTNLLVATINTTVNYPGTLVWEFIQDANQPSTTDTNVVAIVATSGPTREIKDLVSVKIPPFSQEAVAGSSFTDCGGKIPTANVTVVEADSGKTFNLENGQVAAFELEENLTTGYSWDFDYNQDQFQFLCRQSLPVILAPTCTSQSDQPGSLCVGAPNSYRFYFKLLKSIPYGESFPIVANYQRPWENQPINKVVVNFLSPTSVRNPVNWQSQTVSLKADDFYIIANGEKYLANVAGVKVGGDPGGLVDLNTLEVIWKEYGKEMRMYMYFRTDGDKWTMRELRTYNGKKPGDWLYYGSAVWENIPLGQPLTIQTVRHPANMDYKLGEIYFSNLRLQPFLNRSGPFCAGEGEAKSTGNPTPLVCCPDLTPIGCGQPRLSNGQCPGCTGAIICAKCGDGICTKGENNCNCSTDCTSCKFDSNGQKVCPTHQTPKCPKDQVVMTNPEEDNCGCRKPPICQPVNQTLKFKLTFGGVTARPADDSFKKIKLYATSLDGGPALASPQAKQEVEVKVDDNGVYHGEIPLSTDYFGHHYRLRVRGPKHKQIAFSDVIFKLGEELDLTGRPLPPGDISAEFGKIDTNDLQAIDNILAVRMFSTLPADLDLADLNFDKKIDLFDRTLILNTLSVQYDED